ncbi:hypothetical protein VIOR3934_05164 [Vibrio orientalis CIP 102891 = ATCC 33934]|uniref:Uncharacterized protein n=1 Tax=Vibrio orientalis CIP 102891 = ATCC 33934 TaxID=675816 RepID=C9QFC0_VIBOR|nr:hypothetical protein [Vibrio orientalis]EEX94888.1 hypothetical protein VIA_002050 [Vibrio orientalis CIP 102891 = ATCC 33934]EGU52980.1 hypothetical protein VIOR3934_05164 [Vibrio orientalis CIP 102891 = ATCC 33934]
MNFFVQFDEEGMYQNNPWDIPVPYLKGEVRALNPLLAMVLIERNQAHLYHKNQDLQAEHGGVK